MGRGLGWDLLKKNYDPLDTRVTNLEDTYVRAYWFESVASGTSGTIAAPASGATFVLNQWGAGVDALASKISSGVPTFESPVNASGTIITATLDASGNYTLSDTPTAYPVAVIFVYRVTLEYFDDSLSLFETELEDHHNSLDGLQGGTTDEYYHTTAAQNAALHAAGADTSLGTQIEDLDMGDFDLVNLRRVYGTTYLLRVRNESGGTLAQKTPVYATGEASNMVTIDACDITDRDKMPCLGLVFADISTNADGYIVTDGVLRCDTSGLTGDVNDRVYVHAGGTIDTGEPTSGSMQRIGILAKKASGAAGIIHIAVRGRESIFSSADEHPIIRMGSDVGHTKISFHKYDNTEVGYYDEDGIFKVISLTDGTNTATVANLKDAVDKKHTQGTDTALGTQAEALDMGTHQINNVVDPTLDQDAATKKYVDDNATGLTVLRSYLAGLILSNDTGDTEHDIAIAVGICADSTNTYTITLASILTKQIDATWAAGDDAGGMNDGEVVGNATWYHVHLLYNTTTGGVDAGFDTSVTAANLLADTAVVAAGYTKYRRIGSVLTDGSANILQFVQYGDEFYYLAPKQDVNVNNPGTDAVTRTLSTPLGVITQAILHTGGIPGTAYLYIYLSALTVNDYAPALSGTAGCTFAVEVTGATDARVMGQARIFTNTASQIRSRVAYSSSLTFYIYTLGWVDRRGKDD